MKPRLKKILVNLPSVLVEAVDAYGATHGMNRSEAIRTALREHVEREKQKASMTVCNPPTSIVTLKPTAPSA
jgi:metal-responsive CopG/Arc/MetJ family transcriptional regulator